VRVHALAEWTVAATFRVEIETASS
jgi:hypothetical protein